MRTLQIKKLNNAPAGSEEEVIMEQNQYLHQKEMQMQKHPVAVVDLTSAGIKQQCYVIPIAVPNHKRYLLAQLTNAEKVNLSHFTQ